MVPMSARRGDGAFAKSGLMTAFGKTKFATVVDGLLVVSAPCTISYVGTYFCKCKSLPG